MRCFMRRAISLALVLCVFTAAVVRAENPLKGKWTSKIDADPAKSYSLDRAHGPWMVMVASFHTAGSNKEKKLGKTPLEAAHELVLELRRMKVPAYVYEVKAKNESVKAQDTQGRPQLMKNMRLVDSVSVLAGNYPEIDDQKAQQTLKFVKQFNPKCLQTGVDYTVSPGRPGPLSKAFMTSNPLLSQEEMEAAKQASDPLLVALNNDEQFSLYENKGKYTLIVARFSGKSVNVVNESLEKAEGYFTSGGNDLNQAGESACELVHALRSREPLPINAHPEAKELQAYCRLDAYVWHDHTCSYVTVGAFETPNDPDVQKFVKMFGPKVTISASGRQSTSPRFLPILRENGNFNFIPFDPTLRMMVVPHAK
jgi:hypothetical protein